MTELVPKASIEEIVRKRDDAMQLFRSALIQFRSANEALQEAAPGSYGLSVEVDRRYMMTGHDAEESVLTGILASIRKEVDQDVWRYLVEASGMRNFMDTAALKEFEDNLKDPPEVTVQNIHDTLTGLQLQRGRIFRRGLVNRGRGIPGHRAAHNYREHAERRFERADPLLALELKEENHGTRATRNKGTENTPAGCPPHPFLSIHRQRDPGRGQSRAAVS